MATVREEYNTGLTREQIANAFSRALNDMTDDQINALLAQKQNTLTFDNSPTSGSSNPVKSGGVFTAISTEATSRQNADTKQVSALTYIIDDGAKNKLNVWAAPSQTQPINGVTWTVNSDGTVTANGTASGNSWFYLTTNGANIQYGIETVLSGCPEGGSATTWEIQCSMVGGSTRSDYGEGTTQPDNYSYRYVACCIRNGQNVTNLTFKPMVCAKDVYEISSAFKKYVPSNAELWAMIQAQNGTSSVQSLQSPSQLMSVRPDSSLTVEPDTTDIENGGDDV